jgi:hypothetical protein
MAGVYVGWVAGRYVFLSVERGSVDLVGADGSADLAEG